MTPPSYYVPLSAVLFAIGVLGGLIRRDPPIIFMSIELMLNAANLALVAFGRAHGGAEGQALALFVMAAAAAEVGGGPGVAVALAVRAVAAAEVAVGLAIIVSIFQLRRRLSVDELSVMRG